MAGEVGQTLNRTGDRGERHFQVGRVDNSSAGGYIHQGPVGSKEFPMRSAFLMLLLAVPVAFADEPDPKDPKAPVVREVKVTGILVEGRGAIGKPTRVGTAE